MTPLRTRTGVVYLYWDEGLSKGSDSKRQTGMIYVSLWSPAGFSVSSVDLVMCRTGEVHHSVIHSGDWGSIQVGIYWEYDDRSLLIGSRSGISSEYLRQSTFFSADNLVWNIRHRAGKRQSPGLGPRFLEDTATRYTQDMEQLIIYGMTWTACGRWNDGFGGGSAEVVQAGGGIVFP